MCFELFNNSKQQTQLRAYTAHSGDTTHTDTHDTHRRWWAAAPGSKGEPEAKMARPLVHFAACSAVHSAFAVGFDIGKMIGRCTAGRRR